MQAQIPRWEGGIFGEKGAHGKVYRDFVPRAVQKRLNRSTCHFGCELRWAEGNTSSIVFVRLRQFALVGGHSDIGATPRIRLNHLSAAAMRPYLKLLWQLAKILSTPDSSAWFVIKSSLHVYLIQWNIWITVDTMAGFLPACILYVYKILVYMSKTYELPSHQKGRLS